MSRHALSDSRQASRKGRRPKNAIAMTPAERKRVERQRKRDAKEELPDWHRLRLEIWNWVQSRYCLNSAHEVGSALSAIGSALTSCTIWKSMGIEDFEHPLKLLFRPSIDNETSRLLHLGPYQIEPSVEAKAPGYGKTRLASLMRDILERHESKQQNASEVEQ